MVLTDEEMLLAALSLTRKVAALLEGDAACVPGPLAPVDKVGVEAKNAQLGFAGIPEPVRSIHGDKDRTSWSNIVSVSIIESLSLSLLV